jgi:hypothetical protein
LVSYSGKTPTFRVFPVFSVAVMVKCCDACGDGEYYFRSSFRRYRVTVCQRHRRPLTEVDEIYGWLVTVERRRLSVFFLYLAWRLWKSVLTFAVTRNTISGQVFRRSRMSVSQRRRRLLTEIDEIYGWLVAVQRRLTLCVFPVFSVAVMEKCCDACGDGEYYFR